MSISLGVERSTPSRGVVLDMQSFVGKLTHACPVSYCSRSARPRALPAGLSFGKQVFSKTNQRWSTPRCLDVKPWPLATLRGEGNQNHLARTEKEQAEIEAAEAIRQSGQPTRGFDGRRKTRGARRKHRRRRRCCLIFACHSLSVVVCDFPFILLCVRV